MTTTPSELSNLSAAVPASTGLATYAGRPSTAKMGLAYNVYLNAKRIYGCKTCKTHLADHDEIVSRVGPQISQIASPWL